mmetsp:Transcript_3405/g.5436  ORF Transcript_3405/g.5436 Transcript_3405/m.5436 type:complete len:827 (+) Transcript_3405:57-2537(+)
MSISWTSISCINDVQQWSDTCRVATQMWTDVTRKNAADPIGCNEFYRDLKDSRRKNGAQIKLSPPVYVTESVGTDHDPQSLLTVGWKHPHQWMYPSSKMLPQCSNTLRQLLISKGFRVLQNTGQGDCSYHSVNDSYGSEFALDGSRGVQIQSVNRMDAVPILEGRQGHPYFLIDIDVDSGKILASLPTFSDTREELDQIQRGEWGDTRVTAALAEHFGSVVRVAHTSHPPVTAAKQSSDCPGILHLLYYIPLSLIPDHYSLDVQLLWRLKNVEQQPFVWVLLMKLLMDLDSDPDVLKLSVMHSKVWNASEGRWNDFHFEAILRPHPSSSQTSPGNAPADQSVDISFRQWTDVVGSQCQVRTPPTVYRGHPPESGGSPVEGGSGSSGRVNTGSCNLSFADVVAGSRSDGGSEHVPHSTVTHSSQEGGPKSGGCLHDLTQDPLDELPVYPSPSPDLYSRNPDVPISHEKPGVTIPHGGKIPPMTQIKVLNTQNIPDDMPRGPWGNQDEMQQILFQWARKKGFQLKRNGFPDANSTLSQRARITGRYRCSWSPKKSTTKDIPTSVTQCSWDIRVSLTTIGWVVSNGSLHPHCDSCTNDARENSQDQHKLRAANPRNGFIPSTLDSLGRTLASCGMTASAISIVFDSHCKRTGLHAQYSHRLIRSRYGLDSEVPSQEAIKLQEFVRHRMANPETSYLNTACKLSTSDKGGHGSTKIRKTSKKNCVRLDKERDQNQFHETLRQCEGDHDNINRLCDIIRDFGTQLMDDKLSRQGNRSARELGLQNFHGHLSRSVPVKGSASQNVIATKVRRTIKKRDNSKRNTGKKYKGKP